MTTFSILREWNKRWGKYIYIGMTQFLHHIELIKSTTWFQTDLGTHLALSLTKSQFSHLLDITRVPK